MAIFAHNLKNINTDFLTNSNSYNTKLKKIPIGKIPLISQMSLSSAYYDAAQALLDESIDSYNHYDIYATIHPIMYLYRHSVELAIKGLVPPKKCHDLLSLYEQIENHYDVTLSPDITQLIKFINDFDDRSTSFRYADEIRKLQNICIDLFALKKTMRDLNIYFVLLKANIEAGSIIKKST
ncbi:hypothetical protein [Legionella longbeachae]|uniref:hypothetical protein n=1 Tax=Legionella longbeachae TaxID=450 RepID=UPI000A1C1158|nr:hypothetical protein [Legionella longbeachae]ARM34945.1 hypothetical protein B0B39_16125 [Legionella longbeachae]QEY50894.1 hypothetical protein FQU71_06300 [Legionella longbeachae]